MGYTGTAGLIDSYRIVRLLVLVLMFSGTVSAESDDYFSLVSELRELDVLAASLVVDARSGEAHASTFRIQATLYREGLRDLMLENNRLEDTERRLPQPSLIERVRMSALLHAAAECKTGRYIVCPTELMTQLSVQQERLVEDARRLNGIVDGAG